MSFLWTAYPRGEHRPTGKRTAETHLAESQDGMVWWGEGALFLILQSRDPVVPPPPILGESQQVHKTRAPYKRGTTCLAGRVSILFLIVHLAFWALSKDQDRKSKASPNIACDPSTTWKANQDFDSTNVSAAAKISNLVNFWRAELTDHTAASKGYKSLCWHSHLLLFWFLLIYLKAHSKY